MANVAAGKIEAAFDRKMSFAFDLLGDDFTENELFSEVFGADDDTVSTGEDRTRLAARRRRGRKLRELNAWVLRCAHDDTL